MKLFNAVDSGKWSNVLCIVELLFCLPMSNGHLEQVFSQLKLIKGSRHISLGEDTLDRLIRINVEGPPLSKWDASCALELWQKDAVRRVNRKDTQSRHSSTPASSTSSSTCTSTDSSEVESQTDCVWMTGMNDLNSEFSYTNNNLTQCKCISLITFACLVK